MKQRPTRYVPFWALQFAIGALVVLVAIAIVAALIGPVVRGPTAFFDELGKTINRVAPQPQADLRSDDQVKAVIRAMPEGKLRVGTIVEEQDRVVFDHGGSLRGPGRGATGRRAADRARR